MRRPDAINVGGTYATMKSLCRPCAGPCAAPARMVSTEARASAPFSAWRNSIRSNRFCFIFSSVFLHAAYPRLEPGVEHGDSDVLEEFADAIAPAEFLSFARDATKSIGPERYTRVLRSKFGFATFSIDVAPLGFSDLGV